MVGCCSDTGFVRCTASDSTSHVQKAFCITSHPTHPKSYVDQILAANIVPQVRPEVEQSGHSLAGLAPDACSVSPPGAGDISDNSSGNFGEATSLVSATPQPVVATSPTLGPHPVPAMSHATSHGRGAWASSPTPGDRNQQPTSTLVATSPGARAHMEPRWIAISSHRQPGRPRPHIDRDSGRWRRHRPGKTAWQQWS